jgi:hypothetical protein
MLAFATRALAIVLLFLPLAACNDTSDTDQQIVQKDLDPDFGIYYDSLKHYFGDLEIDLIRQYRINHENMQSEEDFYKFFRRASTLRQSLSRTFNKAAQEELAEGQTQVHEVKWFADIVEGMEVLRKPDGKSYAIAFEFEDLEEHAAQTKGTADDNFVKLLHLTYYDHSDTYKWVHRNDDGTYCSELGNGKHLAALVQADKTLADSPVFSKEVQKAKVTIISDILFNKFYCMSKEESLKEIQQVIDQIELKKQEIELLTNRMKQLQTAGAAGVKFGCYSGCS